MASPLSPDALADLAAVPLPWAGMLGESVAARAEAVGLQELGVQYDAEGLAHAKHRTKRAVKETRRCVFLCSQCLLKKTRRLWRSR